MLFPLILHCSEIKSSLLKINQISFNKLAVGFWKKIFKWMKLTSQNSE